MYDTYIHTSSDKVLLRLQILIMSGGSLDEIFKYIITEYLIKGTTLHHEIVWQELIWQGIARGNM